MLGKLMKYELRSMSRAFIPMWILGPIIAFMLSFSIRGTIDWSNSSRMGNLIEFGSGMLMTVMMILFVSAIIGLLVMTVMFVCQRFWNGLLKEEGYLMFTLPVQTWELIVSKALAATLICCVSVVVGVFSGVILAVCGVDQILRHLGQLWAYTFSRVTKLSPVFWVCVILFLILFVAEIACSIYHAYAAMSVGHLFQRHKVIGSCVAYIGFSIVASTISNMISSMIGVILPDKWNYFVPSNLGSMEDAASIVYLLCLLVSVCLEIVVYHVITEKILTTRLNLE